MNEYLLNLAGFTPAQWEEFKGNIANKLLAVWQRVGEAFTPERIKMALAGLGIILGIGLAVLLGNRALIFFEQLHFQPRPEISQATEPAYPKGRLEIKLEELRKEAEAVFDEDLDLLYPSLEVKIEF